MSFPFVRHDPFFKFSPDAFCRFIESPQTFPSPPFEERSFSLFDTEKAPKDLLKPGLSRLCSRDYDCLLRFKDSVIGGYLNLSEAEGWREGNDNRLGASFARYILCRYFIQNKEHLGSNTTVFEKVINAFKACETLLKPLYPAREGEGQNPTESRICYDSSVEGWQKHAVSRLVGNVGSAYSPSKPFFEILVNSARTSADDELCHPFFISVHANAEEMEKRRRLLHSLRLVPPEVAHVSFYASYLKKPGDFLKMHQQKLGPNSTRLLNALVYLQDVTLYAQKVGNCWIKQPMRCLLVTLYVELIAHRHDLAPAEAWNEAKELYKNIQRAVAIPLVKDLIAKSDATPEMKRTALLGLEKQRQL